jgi:hypothetical protein
MTRAIALLDRPTSSSFGMTPLVVREEDAIRVLGLAGPSVHRGRGMGRTDVDDLIAGGHALPVEWDVSDGLGSDAVALWVGDSFAASADALGLPPAPLPAAPMTAHGGTFFLAPATLLHPYLERWTVHAFRRFRSEQSDRARKEIANLMRWVLPDRPESLAAAWATSARPDRELALQIRTFARGKALSAVQAAHEELLRDATDELSDLRLVVFTGGTGVHREEVATRFASQFHLDFRSFRDQIAAHVVPRSAAPEARAEKWVLMDRGQEEVERSPLALALSVLRARPIGKDRVLVLDGLRHGRIRETLTWLQPKKVLVVAVTVDDAERRQRVRDRQEDPDLIFEHKTEREIPDLTEKADRRVPEVAAAQVLREIFDSVHA